MIPIGIQKIRMLIELCIVMTGLIRFQKRKKTLLEIGLEAIGVIFWMRSCLYIAYVLRLCEADFKSNRLLNLAEEISGQHSIHMVASVLLVAFSQIYCDDQKADQKDMKNLDVKDGNKIGAKEVPVVKDITATKEMLTTLPRDNKNDGWRAYQEFVKPYPSPT